MQMRALIVDSAHAPLRLVSIPKPAPGVGQVLVRVAASGVNPLDGKIRAGQAAHARQPLPAVLGMDLAGTVEALGEGVKGWTPGDEVYAMATGIGGVQGSLAEYAVVDARLLARKPGNLNMREAAGLPLVLITAWEGLVDRAQVRAGQKVLIHGGAGVSVMSRCRSPVHWVPKFSPRALRGTGKPLKRWAQRLSITARLQSRRMWRNTQPGRASISFMTQWVVKHWTSLSRLRGFITDMY
jgi:D-arabinose 1-dehydrogenase-like Zn-dependent alcohol dehydrogenase